MTKRKKKIEFSKLIAITAAVVTVLVLIASFILMAIIGDLNPLPAVLAGIFAVDNVVVGFYYWKARTENKLKLEKQYGVKIESPAENEEEETC